MAVDITDARDFSAQKEFSVSAGVIDFSDIEDTTAHTVFNIPANCYLEHALLQTLEAAQAGVTADIAVGTNTVAATAVDDKAVRGHSDLFEDSGTGTKATIKFSAKPTKGRFLVIVKYTQYTVKTGKLTNYADSVVNAGTVNGR